MVAGCTNRFLSAAVLFYNFVNFHNGIHTYHTKTHTEVKFTKMIELVRVNIP